MFYKLIVIILLSYLIFKNNYILGIGGIVLLSYYFTNIEGLTAAQKKAMITAKTVIQKDPVAKKKAATPPPKKK